MNNVKNIIISKNEIECILTKYCEKDIKINSSKYSYYLQAFTHKSFLNTMPYNEQDDSNCHLLIDKHILQNNERLEYFGDAMLYAIIAEYLYDTYPNKDEGFMTNLRIKLIKKSQLAELARKLNFEKYILISSYLEKANARNNNVNLLENLFESFIGALYKDQGFDNTRLFIRGIIKKLINIESLIENDTNFKSKILLYFHAENLGHTEYLLINKEGSFNNLNFYSCIIIKKNVEIQNESLLKSIKKLDKIIRKNIQQKLPEYSFNKDIYYVSEGEGVNKKMSEQKASENLIKILKIK
jgi:ribonuclease-3